ncbi:Glycosyl hydrolase-like 10 domain-containing protein [Candidatus Magnetomoraceae bacterium gMMP-15]
MKRIALIIFMLLLMDLNVQAELVRGIYGVPSVKNTDPSVYSDQFTKAEINAVFTSADKDTINYFKNQNIQVYLSVNAFGGRSGWQKFPDSRPVKADGIFLESKGHGGVCSTHQAWRDHRLNYIKDLIKKYGPEKIDGIWLDFIRYPGFWETNEPKIPDTCYCQRCLNKFQKDCNIKLPENLSAKDSALWIKKNCPYDWMKWKKKQITSFVKDIRDIINEMSNQKHIKLGLFLVPWTKGERQNAISYLLAQDPFELSGLVDVISPMVYHKMCHQNESWVGYMTAYYKETAKCQVWPIIQSQNCAPQEFSRVLKYAGHAGADGVLVYTFRYIKPEFWNVFNQFQKANNLISNPEFKISKENNMPDTWFSKGATVIGGVEPHPTEADQSKNIQLKNKSKFFVKSSDKFYLTKKEMQPKSSCLGIKAGNDGAGIICSELSDCDSGQEYVFTANFYRKTWENLVYPEISVWGNEFYVNTHLLAKTFQPIRLYAKCPEKPHDNKLCFINRNTDRNFWLTRPYLAKNYPYTSPSHSLRGNANKPLHFYKNFFPIGVYGANLNNLENIKSVALNTVFIGGSGENLKKKIEKCHELNIKYVISVPRNPDKLPVFLDEIAKYVKPEYLSFYVNDEPGIHSFPMNKAYDIYQLIKNKFPEASTCMAVVRPQVCRDYLNASDFFMMDQYPVPSQPMTWLSDSMDAASKDVGKQRLASVIQAFGGKKWADVGWPRMPTWQEMDCLAFLSVVHGSNGIFFYTFSEIGKTKEGRYSLGRVVGRLNRIYPWLMKKNINKEVNVEMISAYQVDPMGRPAIHCCLKKHGNQVMLIAVNSIGTYVEGKLKIAGEQNAEIVEVEEVFSGNKLMKKNGILQDKFKPYEAKAYVFNLNKGKNL